ncbi:hypothetical protein ACQPZF_32930 [Actinosynnema sp. CS-041913]|uniref:hypothetical protein n=1 Tax=Actinosynnema sp. CS-041913 TaxID=3239917 RepID=UPI003D93BA86
MSTHIDDPDRTPPQGIPRVDPSAGRRAAPMAPGTVDAWAAAEAQHRAQRARPVEDEPVYRNRFTPAATDPDGWSVAPAVIGGELPETPPPAPQARPASHEQPAPRPDAAPPAAKRSFLGKLFNRDK